MMKFRLGLFGLTLTSALALAGSSSNAADIYVPPAPGPGGYKDACCAPVWTGFYLGVNAGYGWSVYDDQLSSQNLIPPVPGVQPQGGFGGGQIGYNWQFGKMVLGIEADIQDAGITDKKFDTLGDKSFTRSALDWFGTARGRLGYAFDNALVYATGGFAYGNIHNHFDAGPAFNPPVVFDINTMATGYVLGGGVEYKLAAAWSLKMEYQYINLGSNDPVRAVTGDHFSKISGAVLHDDAFNTIRAGLNYRFGGSYEPLK